MTLTNSEQEIIKKLIVRISRGTGLESTQIIQANKDVGFPLGSFCSLMMIASKKNGGWIGTGEERYIDKISTVSVQFFRDDALDLMSLFEISSTAGTEDFVASDGIEIFDFSQISDTSFTIDGTRINRVSATLTINYRQKAVYKNFKVVEAGLDKINLN